MTKLSEFDEEFGRASEADEPKKRGKRGFASMSPEMQRKIASKGGTSVAAHKRSFSQNKELAVNAGRKGGTNLTPEKRSFSRDRELAKSAGRKGGKASE